MILVIWGSFRALPLWVQLWVAVILVPVNMISIGFLDQPLGGLVAVLAIGAMALNGVIMLVERGFSKAMAIPHVVIWVPLVIGVAGMLWNGVVGGGYAAYLAVLLVVDGISLLFDFKDGWAWWRGERQVAR